MSGCNAIFCLSNKEKKGKFLSTYYYREISNTLCSLSDATPEPPNDELILFGAGDGVTDTHFDGSASQFPSPELENVLEVTNTHIKYFNPNM